MYLMPSSPHGPTAKSIKLHFIVIISCKFWTYLGLNYMNFIKLYIIDPKVDFLMI